MLNVYPFIFKDCACFGFYKQIKPTCNIYILSFNKNILFCYVCASNNYFREENVMFLEK